jgi:hypothetical protein
MRITSARPKPMPPARAEPLPWVSALLWLVFCAVMVAVSLYLSPGVGAVYASEDMFLPTEPGLPQPVSADNEHAVPMAMTVLYPNETVEIKR